MKTFSKNKQPVFALSLLKICLILVCIKCNIQSSSAQATNKSLSAIVSENQTGVEKLTVLHNQLYAFGYGGPELKFANNKPSLYVNSFRKLFIAKYDQTGAYSKAVSFGGNTNNINGDVCTLPNNLICASGVFASGYYEENKRLSENLKGVFITVLDSSLGFKWRLIFNADKIFNCNLLCPDGKGNFYAAGYFTNMITIDGTNFQAKNLPNPTDFNKDIFILRIKQDGEVLNTFTMGSFGHDYPTALTCDEAGNVIVAAIISDTVLLGDKLYEQQGKSRGVIFKMSPEGKTFWITGLSGAGINIGSLAFNSKYEILCGASFSGSLYIKNQTVSERVTTDGLSYQLFIGAFNTSGKLLRNKTEGSENPTKLKAMCLDKDDNIFISGTFQCTFTSYNLKNETFSFKNIGYDDIYLGAYNSAIVPLWQKHSGGKKVDNVNDLVWWQNRPTISGDFIDNFYQSCDSITPLLNATTNYDIRGNYYKNYYPGPFYLDILVKPIEPGKAGFITNIMNAKSPQLNYFQQPYKDPDKFSEKPVWGSVLSSEGDTTCNGVSLYSYWSKSNSYDDYYAGNNGPDLNYFVNGQATNIKESTFSKSGHYKLEIKTKDGCYSEILEKDAIVYKTERNEISYDKNKLGINGSIQICDNDSVVLTAGKTFGLKYYWVVNYQDYLLDTGNVSDTTNKLKYGTIKRDTFYTKAITIKKNAFVSLIPEKNKLCKEASYSLSVNKLKFANYDSLSVFFTDTSENLCSNGSNGATKNFKVKLIDKKTGLEKIVPFVISWQINGGPVSNSVYRTNDNIGFSVKNTGLFIIEGYIDLGCEKKYFSIQKYYYMVKPTIALEGNLSKCRNVETIFKASPGYIKYTWGVSGTPDTPSITYLVPGEIKVKGSVNYIWVRGWSDTSKNSCYATAEKKINIPTSSVIFSNINPPLICQGHYITLRANDGTDYLWYPNGETSQQIATNMPGIYSCTYKDVEGCVIKSTNIELAESFKPDLIIQPDDSICPGQSADINIIAPKYAAINWTQPSLFGKSSHVTTKQAGIVKCIVEVCNTYYSLQGNVVFKKPYSPKINYHTDSFCDGNYIKIESHDSERFLYKWSYLTNVKYKDSKIISYTASEMSGKKTLTPQKAGVYLSESKDYCENWYKTDFYTIKNSNKAGMKKFFKKDICGDDSFLFDLKNLLKPPPDPFNKCLWLKDKDTLFLKKFSPQTNQYSALISNKYCSWPDTVTLMVNKRIIPYLGVYGETDICPGKSVWLRAMIKDTIGNKNIIWNHNLGNGANKLVTVTNEINYYKASLYDSCGTISDSIRIIPRIIEADFISEYNADFDKTILNDNSRGSKIMKWYWTLDNSPISELNTAEILDAYKNDYLVCLKISNDIGCRDSICKILPVYVKGDFYIPGIFNPLSGIAVNSRFAPISNISLRYNLLIFNRWGEKLFDGGNESLGWDGTYKGVPCPDGNYVYVINLKYVTQKGFYIEKNIKGTLMLVK